MAQEILARVTERVSALSAGGTAPRAVFVTIGESEEAQLYAARLGKLARSARVELVIRDLAGDVSPTALEQEVATLNADQSVDGILIQMPLPRHITHEDMVLKIDARKDVDGISIESAGRLYLGLPGSAASTAVAMMEMLDYAGMDPRGCRAAVVGRSPVVGHPVAELLLHRHATVTITHSRTRDLGSVTREAEILMLGAGKPRLITGDMVRPGAMVVDAGINVTADGIVGDADFEACSEIAAAITPVPGGIGPVTNAVLLRAVVDSAERRGG